MNLRIFEDKSKAMREVIDAIIREVGSCLLTTKEFHGFVLVDLVHDWKTCISFNSPLKIGSILWWQPSPSCVSSILMDLRRVI